MEIVIICPDFPTKVHFRFTFVKELAGVLTRLNNNVTVVAPQSITKAILRAEGLTKRNYKQNLDNNLSYKVIRPYLLSFGSFIIFRKLNFILFRYAIERGLFSLNSPPQVIYAHFWVGGISCIRYSDKYKIKVVVGSGEETINFHKYYRIKNINRLLGAIHHIIPVSNKTKKEIQETLSIPNNKITVVNNGYDESKFFESVELRENKRRALKIEDSDIVFIFVGQFTDRKGVDKIDRALKEVANPRFKAIYIGSGPITPTYRDNVFVGRVPHDDLNEYLNASDIFIFPSENEGCPNSVIEAIGVGLPILIPDLEYSKDILPESYDGYINLNDAESLVNLIKQYGSNPELRTKSQFQIKEIRSNLTLTKRGVRVNQILLNTTK